MTNLVEKYGLNSDRGPHSCDHLDLMRLESKSHLRSPSANAGAWRAWTTRRGFPHKR